MVKAVPNEPRKDDHRSARHMEGRTPMRGGFLSYLCGGSEDRDQLQAVRTGMDSMELHRDPRLGKSGRVANWYARNCIGHRTQ